MRDEQRRSGVFEVFVNNRRCNPVKEHLCTPDVDLLDAGFRSPFLLRDFARVMTHSHRNSCCQATNTTTQCIHDQRDHTSLSDNISSRVYFDLRCQQCHFPLVINDV